MNSRVVGVMRRTKFGKWCTWPGVAFVLCYPAFLGSCTSSDGGGIGGVIDERFPTQHTFPAWADASAIYLVNTGAIRVDGGTATDEELRGIIRYDLLSREGRMVVLDGEYPALSRQGQIFAALRGGGDGAIVIGTDSTYYEVGESETWSNREDLTISYNGRLLAWCSRGSEHSPGIWTMEVDSGIYRYLGPGFYCRWSPSAEKLVYRASDVRTRLIEYEYETGERDTLIDFPTERSGTHFSYAPNGEDMAYFCRSIDEFSGGVYLWDRETGLERHISHHLGYGLDWGIGGIIYANSCEDEADPGCGVIWHVDPVSGESRQLTERYQFTSDGRR